MTAAEGIGLFPTSAAAQSIPIVIEDQAAEDEPVADQRFTATDSGGQIKRYASTASDLAGSTVHIIMPPLTTRRKEVPNVRNAKGTGNRIQSKPDIQQPVHSDNNYMVIRIVVWWLITLAWAIQIFYLSTATFSSSRSESLLAEILASFHLNVSAYTLGIVNSLLRKLAHLIQYSIFCLLLYRSVGGWNHWRPHLARWCILAAAAYSLTDEFHQMLVPGRGPSLIDCGIDTIGAALAMLLVYQRARFLQRGFPTPD